MPDSKKRESFLFAMKERIFISLCSFSAFLMLLSIQVQAVNASSHEVSACHCFRNRTFNPQDKASSDDYLLTTTTNSLIASEFDIPKRQIIMRKMRDGVKNVDLITALYLARESGINAARLLEMKQEKPWSEVINMLKTSKAMPQDDSLSQPSLEGNTDKQIAETILNRIIVHRFAPGPDAIANIRDKGFTLKEIIVVLTLAEHSGKAAMEIARLHTADQQSWSEIAHSMGLQPAEVGKLLEKEMNSDK